MVLRKTYRQQQAPGSGYEGISLEGWEADWIAEGVHVSKFGHIEDIISLHWDYHVDAYIHGAVPIGSIVTYEYM